MSVRFVVVAMLAQIFAVSSFVQGALAQTAAIDDS
jgi:hypothetical protein